MGDTLHVFISATSGDLGTVRELVKQGLLTMNCTPVEQENFPPDYRTVAAMLEERIGRCEAVIHLVGLRYGMEPDPASLPAGAARRSYTQMEADLARKLGKKLYTFVCPEDFPYDTCAPEPDDLAALQRAYRQEIVSRSTLHTLVADREDVGRRIRELQLDLEKMRAGLAQHRRRTAALAAGFVLLLAGLAALIGWNVRPAVLEKTATDAAQKAVAGGDSIDPVRIKANLQKQIKARAAEEIAKLDPVRDWEKIAELEKGRDQQLGDVDRLVEQMKQVFEKKEASANYAIATQLLAEKGVTETLRFLESKSGPRETKIAALKGGLELTEHVRAAQIGELREALREKLLAASLLEKDGQWDKAEAEYRAVVRDGGTWPEPRNQLAQLLWQRGIFIEPAEGNRKLREAIDLCLGTLAANSPEADPDAWAETQRTLANAAGELGLRSSGKAGQQLLGEAVAAYRAALAISTRDRSPEDWAGTQNNLGTALSDQGTRAEGAESVRLLGEAVTAFRAALEVSTREQWPQAWAMTQNNLAVALRNQGTRAEGAESVRLLGEAVTAYRAALEVYTRELLPQDWAMTQNNLGIALWNQGERAEAAESLRLLGEAVRAFRAALEVFTREELPQDWAMTQNNLAVALKDQGTRAEGAESQRLLGEAVTAFRAALQVYTREQSPQYWATTQNNLGIALRTQGTRAEGAESLRLLGEAVTAYRAALEVRTREQLPQKWAMTQNNLGIALRDQGTRAEAAESLRLLGEAVTAYRAVLEVYTREHLPYYWRGTQGNLAIALRALAERSKGAEAKRLRAEADMIAKELAAEP
jgi:tetratricopeptide (TPR) repeat protein